MSSPKLFQVGFIGLGAMGKPMALNLLKAGHTLTVKSRSRGPLDELVAAGASEAASPREVAEASDVVITMLPNTPDVEEVCLGEGGIIEAAKSAADSGAANRPLAPADSLTVIDMSTISPQGSVAIGEKFAEAGIDYLEAPVSGGDVGAQAGTLAIMCGGPERVFDRVVSLFEVMGKSWTRIGEWGAGQTTKLANNIICATTIESIGEALVLGAKAGLDPMKMYEAIRGGAAACWSLDHKVPMIAERNFEPGFKVKLHLKDLNLAIEAAEELGVALPVAEMVRDMLAELVETGHGEEDNGALVKIIEKMAGIEVKKLEDAL